MEGIIGGCYNNGYARVVCLPLSLSFIFKIIFKFAGLVLLIFGISYPVGITQFVAFNCNWGFVNVVYVFCNAYFEPEHYIFWTDFQ